MVNFLPILIEAVKELNIKLEVSMKENEKLKTENEKIKSSLGDMQLRMQSLEAKMENIVNTVTTAKK